MSGRVKFGLIGAGAIAQSYLSAFENVEEATLVAIADIDAEAAKTKAKSMKCKGYDDPPKLVAEADCDAVIISTPPNTHPEIAELCLSKGIHVLCEKPLSITSESAEQMIDLADKNGALLTMGSKFRYVEDVIKAKSIVDSGILGEIILFENAFTGWVDMTTRWNSNPEISGGGVLIDNGTHSVDIMRYFLGPLRDVHVVEGKRLQTSRVEDTVRIFARSNDGVMGSVDLSWSINKELSSYIDIYGSMGTIKVGWQQSCYRQSSSSDWIVFGDGYNKVQAFSSQLRNLARAIQGKEQLLITSADALASVKVIEAGYESLRRFDWVAIDENGSGARAA